MCKFVKLFLALVLTFHLCSCSQVASSSKNRSGTDSIYSFSATTIEGENISLSKYKGKVLLIANIALNCGTTIQIGDLEEIYKKYKEQGLEILAFPTEDFSSFGVNGIEDVTYTCQSKFKTNFPIFSKTNVLGKDISDLFNYLTTSSQKKDRGPITFNFEKFLISRNGTIFKRYGSFTNVQSDSFQNDLQKLLMENP